MSESISAKLEKKKEEEKREHKLCPLSAGNEVDWWICVEDKCAWWDDQRKECMLKTLVRSTLALGLELAELNKNLELLTEILQNK
ncbi:MAG: hypothetical protein ACP5JY_03200 [Candidatus Nanoarchaeia archaeon]